MLIDTHAHLNFHAFDKDFDLVIKRAEEKKVKKIIIPSTKLSSSRKAVSICEKHKQCYATIGIHPHHVNDLNIIGSENIFKQLLKISENKKVIAFGETGIDYYHYKNYPPITDEIKKSQQELFSIHLEIAVRKNLPLIFHCRNAYKNMIDILKKYSNINRLSAVFHCFEGDKDNLNDILNMGFFIGINGIITYPKNYSIVELVKYAGVKNILLETDSPYLTPYPHRSKRNEPENLELIAKFLAQKLGVDLEMLEYETEKNTYKLFRV
jgi:TatD DNase family protein